MENKIIISITSYPLRINTVHITINSLITQTIKADKIILWLAKEQFPNLEQELPQPLINLKKYNFSIEWYHDIRSYKKLIPALKKYPDAIIVTADDDNIYQSTWLEKLIASYKQHPNDIHAHRVTKFFYHNGFDAIGGGSFYANASYLNKLVGVGGVLYPPHCFSQNILNESLMMQLAPTNDDQWFWLHGVLNGVRVRVVEDAQNTENYVPGTQHIGLNKINDQGNHLFWKDFSRIVNYYPQLIPILKEEQIKFGFIPDRHIAKYCDELCIWYKHTTGKKLSFTSLRTFNEKIQWIKLFNATPEKTICSDKYLAHSWVAQKIGKEYVIPILGVYNSFEEIPFKDLPKKFIIKCNHGQHYTIVVKDKNKLHKDNTKRKINNWLNENYAYKNGYELHYRNISQRIIIEEFIESINSKKNHSYKLWCFYGKVKFIQVVSENNTKNETAFYDLNWNKQLFTYSHKLSNQDIPKPANLDKILHFSEILSEKFIYARVDFYVDQNGVIYFDKINFTPESGQGQWSSKKINYKFGQMIKIPNIAFDIDTNEYYQFSTNNKKLLPSFSRKKIFLCIKNIIKSSIVATKIINTIFPKKSYIRKIMNNIAASR